jgi:anti-sigma factor RsiW
MINPQVTSHERSEADLAELATGLLGSREEAALLSHLASCPSCAADRWMFVSRGTGGSGASCVGG